MVRNQAIDSSFRFRAIWEYQTKVESDLHVFAANEQEN